MSHRLKSHRDEAYLRFIRSRPCSVTGVEGDEVVVAHHIRCLGGGGTGLKPSDYLCVPLSSMQHQRLHNNGEVSFWKEWGQDPRDLVSMNLLIYMATKGVPYDRLIEFFVSLE